LNTSGDLLATTQRIGLSYPDQGQRDWYALFADFADGIDSAIYACRQDRNDLVTFDSTQVFYMSGVLTWLAPIYITSSITGVTWVIAPSSITIGDDKFLTANPPQNPSVDTTVTVNKVDTITNNDTSVALAFCQSGVLTFRNGLSVETF
jgi:hypothetical protein